MQALLRAVVEQRRRGGCSDYDLVVRSAICLRGAWRCSWMSRVSATGATHSGGFVAHRAGHDVEEDRRGRSCTRYGPRCTLLKWAWVDLELLGSADRGGAMTKGWHGTEADPAVGTERRARWPAAMYRSSCGPTGLSTSCAPSTPAHRPWRVTHRPSLRAESNYRPCGPSWTEAPRPSASSHRRRILQTGAWAYRGPSPSAAEAVNADRLLHPCRRSQPRVPFALTPDSPTLSADAKRSGSQRWR